MDEGQVFKVLIVEDDVKYSSSLAHCFSNRGGFEVVGVTGSEFEAYHLIKECLPDIIIVDLMLAEGNGLSFLEEINDNAKFMPKNFYKVIVSAFLARHDLKKVRHLSDVYFTKHPYAKTLQPDVIVTYLTTHSEEIAEKVKRKKISTPKKSRWSPRNPKRLAKKLIYDDDDVAAEIEDELNQYTLSVDRMAKIYLQEALFLAVTRLEYKDFLLKDMYLELSQTFEKTPDQIQKKLVNLLHFMFTSTNPSTLEKLYGKSIKSTDTKTFLIQTARKIQKQLLEDE